MQASTGWLKRQFSYAYVALGGNAYTGDSCVERIYHEARVFAVTGGAEEVNLERTAPNPYQSELLLGTGAPPVQSSLL